MNACLLRVAGTVGLLLVSVLGQQQRLQGPQNGRASLLKQEKAAICGKKWPEYSELHGRIVQGESEGGFVVFRPDPWRGYANQLLGISSAFALALLMGRALVIDDPSLARIFFSPHIRWDTVVIDGGPSRTAPGGMKEGLVWDELKDCSAEATLEREAGSWDLGAMAEGHTYVVISTNVVWWPWLFRSERYAEVVASWGLRAIDDFFPCAMQYLLQPTPTLEKPLIPLLDQMRGKHTVGLQLRMNPETAQVRVEDSRHMIECGRKILLSRGIDPNGEQVRWVIATDLPDVVDNVRAELGENNVVWWNSAQDDGTGRAVGALIGEEGMEWERAASIEEEEGHRLKRAVDHYILSLCDVCVISFGSTFGLTAALMHPGGAPHFVFGRHYHQAWVPPSCEQSPCGGAQGSSCFGKKAFGYFGLCDEDVQYGHGVEYLTLAAETNPRGNDGPLFLPTEDVVHGRCSQQTGRDCSLW